MSGDAKPSVIRIRIEGLNGIQLARILADVIVAAGNDLAKGAAVSVTVPNLVRVRHLPLC